MEPCLHPYVARDRAEELITLTEESRHLGDPVCTLPAAPLFPTVRLTVRLV
jgi:hypothetical protein